MVRLSNFSYVRLAILQLKTNISRLFKSHTDMPFMIGSDTGRMSFPPVTLSKCFKLRHFAGSSCASSDHCDDVPSNYFSITLQIYKSFFHNYPRKLISDANVQRRNVIDFIFHLKDSNRPLSMIRLVNSDVFRARPLSRKINDSGSTYAIDHSYHARSERRPSIDIDEDESYKLEVETMKEILSCITVPVRNNSLSTKFHNHVSEFDKKSPDNVEVLTILKEGDLRRHLIASRLNIKEAAVRVVKCAAWYVSLATRFLFYLCLTIMFVSTYI